MPKAWTPKDERMYRHIVQSCTKSRRKPKSVCKSIAAATVNKLRKKQGRTLSGFVVEASRRSANDPETGGWAPGWSRGEGAYRTRAEAQAAIAKRGLKGAKYRIKSDGLGCGCEGKRR
jgi:hypothetical protein